ncbi:MAG: TlyA family RNA methyltransferase [Deltaproteobacteria bacterium]|nr:TlyA family RNA methyltransferase [Deltaproteobacteria bacterium]
MAVKKVRLDKMLVERGIAPTLEKARALILARAVKVDETWTDKAGALVAPDAEIHVKGEDNPYVSRGGLKLAGALKEFNLAAKGIVALDVGASTGGFTDCLLQSGARKVYALDVGYGQLAWKLREDRRVVVIERTNIRYYDGAELDEAIDLAVIDASFISLKTVLPAVLKLLGDKAQILALIKPQFEVAKSEVGEGGVVRNSIIHDRVVRDIRDFCESLELDVEGTCASPVLGPAGNREFFILARKKVQGSNLYS